MIKNLGMILDCTKGTGAFTVYMGSNLTLDNVNILATNNVHGANTCLIRVYDANSTITILNSNVTVDETFKPGTGASALVLFDKEKTGGALVIENTIVDASKAPVTFPIAKATAAGNTVTVKNSVLTASAETDAFIGFAEGEVAYKGVDLVNGELIVDVEGIRAEAIELGYAFEIGEVADAYNLGKFTGYYYTASMAAQSLTPTVSGIFMDKIAMTSLFPYASIFVGLAFFTMLMVKHGDSKVTAKRGLEALDIDD